MSNTVNPFGCTYLNLNAALCKMGRTSQMMFNFYIACRMEIKAWEFNAPDIVAMTGITKKAVLGYCRAMENAGLFSRTGTTDRGAIKYTLDRTRFKQHLQSTIPLEPIFSKVLNINEQDQHGVVPRTMPTHGPENHACVVPTTTQRSPENHAGVVLTTNKDIRVDERENERHTPKKACVSVVHNASEDEHDNPSADKGACHVEAAPRKDPYSKDRPAMIAKIRQERKLSDNVSDADINAHIQNKEWEAIKQRNKEDAIRQKRERRDRGCESYCEKQIISPLKDNEQEAGISPADKVACLKAGIECNNHNGFLNYGTGETWYSSIMVPKKGLELALEFFTLNPACKVSDVLSTLEMCGSVRRFYEKPEKGTYAEHFHAWKGGESLQYFFANLPNVIANLESMKYPCMDMLSVPAFTPLPVMEESQYEPQEN